MGDRDPAHELVAQLSQVEGTEARVRIAREALKAARESAWCPACAARADLDEVSRGD